MRQPASSESSPQSSDLLALKPPLSSALSSLNVYLEEELARYRRQRQGRPISPEKTSKTIKPSRKPLDLIAVKTNNSSRSQSSTPSKQPSSGAVPPPPPPNPFLNKAGSAASAAAIPTISNQAAEPAGQLAVAAKPADHNADAACALATHASDEVIPDDYLESSEELIKSLADQRMPESETAAQTPQPRFIWPSKLATPVSVGSFLLLLVTSAGLGYVVTNPAAVNHLFRRFRPHTHPPMPAVESANSAAGLYGGGTFRPLGPDLSNQEFIDLTLDTLSTLPSNTERLGLQPPISTNASATPETPPAPPSQTQPNTAPTNPNSANLAPSSQPSVTPAPQSYSAAPPTAVSPRPTTSATPTAPRPAPSATPPVAASANPASHSPAPSVAVSPPTSTALPSIVTAPAPVVTAPVAPPAAAATASSGSTPTAIPRYRVVTPYTGDPSLDKVRGVVADAFVRESQIQAGAFEDETAAQARVQELLERGIPAQVYAD